jgi:hypothetical protein
MSVITLLTDFGNDSPYIAAMKGAILTIAPECRIIDLTHGVRPQNIREGAIILHDLHEIFPKGSIHVAVVDPGVGTDRKILAAKLGDHFFVAPDNGLLGPMLESYPQAELINLTRKQYWRNPVSKTFHGRDIMAPVAAHLATGTSLEELGLPFDSPLPFSLPKIRIHQEQLLLASVFHDSFGNIITNLLWESLDISWRDRMVSSRVLEWRRESGEAIEAPFVATYGEGENGEAVCLVGSTGRIELAVVQGNAAERFGISPEEKFSLRILY